MTTFKKTTSNMGITCFSNKPEMYLWLRLGLRKKLPSVSYLKQSLSSPPGDAMLIIPRKCVPSAIDVAFENATEECQREYRDQAMDFWADFKQYCKYVGFCTLIINKSRAGSINPALGVTLERLSAQEKKREKGVLTEKVRTVQNIFGEDLDKIVNVSFIVTAVINTHWLGPLSLSLLMAHELGHLKLMSQSRQPHSSFADYSYDGKELFAQFYAYSMARSLFSFLYRQRQNITDPAVLLDIQAAGCIVREGSKEISPLIRTSPKREILELADLFPCFWR